MKNLFSVLIIIPVFLVLLGSCKKNEEALPKLEISDALIVQEGTESQNKAIISFNLSIPASKEVTITWSTLDGTAVAGEDYVAQEEVTTVFKEGDSEKTVEVLLINDDIFEGDEKFSVSVTGVKNATLGNSTCYVTIENDDAFIPELELPSRYSQAEGTSSQTIFRVPVSLSGKTDQEVRFNWSTSAGWAKINEDFLAVGSTQVVFSPGETEKILEVTVLNDDVFEMDDYFDILVSDVQGANSSVTSIRVYIINDDTYQPELASDGYITPDTWPGMQLVWSDEFEGSTLNTNDWGYDLGGGGWGNNELQIYTNSSQNSYLSEGKLNIVATKLYESYYSARLLTKGKKDFTYGRIDIRALMPYGQGIWPALWTLGSNISSVGWPKCGEIDIVEYLGHQEYKVYGTPHYYDSGHQFITGFYTLPGGQSFHDKFHVFSVVWQENTIKWYVDYHLFFQVDDTGIAFESFRLPQFFIFNLAVGGTWPGYPDETTVFPQSLLVDYIRVFQVE
jgi:beta-glucanase (GH16 family)